MVSAIKNVCKSADHEVILWTCRVNDRLKEAVNFCNSHNIKFAAINSNSPNNLAQYGTDPRKVYADVYLDDRMCGYDRNTAIDFLEKLYRRK